MMQVLTDAQWAKFEAAIKAVGIRGARPRKDDRRTIEAILWRLDNGAKWRAIPAEFGNWHHAYLRFRRWTVAGVWDKIMAHESMQNSGVHYDSTAVASSRFTKQEPEYRLQKLFSSVSLKRISQ